MSHPVPSYEEKVKLYIRVAVILAAITVVEVALTFVPHHEQPMKTIITMLIVLLSCSKAFFVAYYYMHLNHEHKWTKIVAASPVIILLYAAALIADTPNRPVDTYVGAPKRGVMYPDKAAMELKEAEAKKKAEAKKSDPLADELDAEESDGWE
jgi:caa(3)-type oxidase subunit IV